MNSKKKVFICILTLCICIFGTSLVSYAATSEFTLTVTRSGSNEDNMSKRTLKAGGDRWENYFYVTSTSYAGTTGTIKVKSIKLYDTTLESEPIRFGTAKLKTDKERYKRYAPSGEYYYLKGEFVASTGNVVKMLGRYTP